MPWRQSQPKSNQHAQEPGELLFRQLRHRLTFWYCGVLGAALILFGVVLYIVTSYALLGPLESSALMRAQGQAQSWSHGTHDEACMMNYNNPYLPHPDEGFAQTEVTLCFNRDGSILTGEDTTGLPSILLTNNTVLKAAVQTGQDQSGFINGGDPRWSLYCYAAVVSGSNGGIVMVGEVVKPQQDALSSLLLYSLAIGVPALLLAGLGGLFLAKRAMVPARLAWENQQRFIADASHELRTPLTLMRADAEVLLRGREHMDTEDTLLLEDIVAEASHMGNLTTNLLTLARLDTNRSHREHEVINLAELAQNGVQRMQALAEQRQITVQGEYAGKPFIIGDPMQLEQAMLVLLDNAIKYNRDGGTVNVLTTTQGEYAYLKVQDSGIGIAAEHLSKLGERFYRVDKARSREMGGTGLGLSIARGIAISHDGELMLSSSPQQGTTVTLKLPLAHRLLPGDNYNNTPTDDPSLL